MKHHITLIIIITVLISIFSKKLNAQQDACGFSLIKAEKLYEEGNLEGIPQLLEPCIISGFTKDEKLQAYKLLILVYLFEDKQLIAEQRMIDFLEFEPEYQLTATDPVEFVQLFKSFRTLPVYAIGGGAGFNVSYAKIKNEFGVYNTNTSEAEYYPSQVAIQVGAGISRYIVDNFNLNFEFFFKQSNYKYKCKMFDFSEVNFIETRNELHIPLSLMFSFSKIKYRPFLRAGIALDLLIDSRAKVSRNYLENNHLPVTGSDISITNQRNKAIFNFVSGAGLKYSIPRGYFIIEMRYNFGLTNIIKPTTRFDNQELIFKYHYIDNDLIINNLQFNISYMTIIYKPQKKKIKE